MPSSGEGLECGADVGLGPAIVVGEHDVGRICRGDEGESDGKAAHVCFEGKKTSSRRVKKEGKERKQDKQRQEGRRSTAPSWWRRGHGDIYGGVPCQTGSWCGARGAKGRAILAWESFDTRGGWARRLAEVATVLPVVAMSAVDDSLLPRGAARLARADSLLAGGV